MKIICIGRNYAEHAQELGNDVPEVPVFFLKPDTALLRSNLPFFYPDFSTDIHYETELIVRINRLGKSIPQKYARDYYDEIGIGIDFTARDLQQECKAKGLPWEIAKAFDNSAAISKYILKETLPAPDNLHFHLDINGKTVQKGNSADMIFSFDAIIAYVSQFMTLRTGDLIFTGTPAGVGSVKINDLLDVYLEGERMMHFRIK